MSLCQPRILVAFFCSVGTSGRARTPRPPCWHPDRAAGRLKAVFYRLFIGQNEALCPREAAQSAWKLRMRRTRRERVVWLPCLVVDCGHLRRHSRILRFCFQPSGSSGCNFRDYTSCYPASTPYTPSRWLRQSCTWQSHDWLHWHCLFSRSIVRALLIRASPGSAHP